MFYFGFARDASVSPVQSVKLVCTCVYEQVAIHTEDKRPILLQFGNKKVVKFHSNLLAQPTQPPPTLASRLSIISHGPSRNMLPPVSARLLPVARDGLPESLHHTRILLHHPQSQGEDDRGTVRGHELPGNVVEQPPPPPATSRPPTIATRKVMSLPA